MSFPSSICKNSPELAISDVRMNLETQFMEDLSKAEGMRVFARVRPMLISEIEAGHKEYIGTIDEQTLRAVVPASSVKYKSSSHLSQDIIEDFKFTSAYGPEVGQFVFFEESMMSTMQNFIEGQNSLVFSYGITGSGKTYTLQGDPNNPGIIPLSLHLFFASIENQLLDRIVVKPDKFDDVLILNDNEMKQEHQLIEQLLSTNNQEEWSFRNSTKSLAMVLCEAFSDKFEGEGRQTTLEPEEMAQAQAAALMKELSKKSAEQQTGYCNVWVSFVEIYNETVYDLLQPNVNQRTKLTLGEDKSGNVYVKGLREVCVFNSYEALKLLNFGQRNLKIASTKLNYQSSRSHCVFTVKVVRIPDLENLASAKINRLSFCDLAGSERAAKSQTTGLRLKEAGCINTSLLVLGRCLEQLRLNPSQRDKKLIPFRESKLTRLLSGFFTGKGKAVMITNASPSEVTFDETLHALRFSAVATELIINDSYIATASNTLQTITNMWTNARANVSTSSDKSISFDDSEALREKDELIEKLLDLAESLTNNLEKEKKEKAELEIKIRQEVCQEYSEYSDELLERQKQNYEEEQEAIRAIYKRRISAMEKMYEKIIEDYKLQTDESDSSFDEAAADAGSNALQYKSNERKSAVSEKSFEEETKENIEEKKNDSKDNLVTQAAGLLLDIEVLKEDLQTISEELKGTKEELEKSKDYCLSLETATEEMEKKLEISNFNLEKALTENGEIKIKVDYLQAFFQDNVNLKKEADDELNCSSDLETLKEQYEDVKLKLENTLKINENLKEELDALKIDCVSYKADNDNLFKKKTILDGQLMSLSDELVSVKSGKEDLYQKLKESERNVTILGDEVKILLEKKNELIELQEESKEEYEKSLEEAKKEVKEAEEVLRSVNQTLDNALMVTEGQKEKLVASETECVYLKSELADILKRNEDLDEKYALATEELEFEKCKAKTASSELEKSLQEIKKFTEELDTVKFECLEYEKKVCTLQETNLNLEEKVSSVFKKLESEKTVYKQEFDVLNSKFEEALSTTDIQKIEFEKLLENNNCYQDEIAELQKANKELVDKLSIQAAQTESEKLAYKRELDTMSSKLSEALSALDKQKQEVENLTNVTNSDKNKISELQKQNKELQDDINSQTESGNIALKEEFDVVSNKLEAALCTIHKQKEELESMVNENSLAGNKILDLLKSNEELEKRINSQTFQTESNVLAFKKELDAVNIKLADALSALDKQKQEVENLSSIINSDKSKIAELQKQNKEFQDNMNSQAESETLTYKKELDAVNVKLADALSALNKEKKEMENLNNVINSDNKIAELQEQNKEFEDNMNSQELNNIALKEELDVMSIKLEESLGTINKQKEKLEIMLNESHSAGNKVADLLKMNEELEKRISFQTFQTDVLYELIHVLEKCELQASLKMKVMQSNFLKFEGENENLKKQLKQNNDGHENECSILHKMIQILQKCEMFASNKRKELHTSSIKHVEQIMDFEECVKQRDANIEGLKNDYNLLQKELKDLQAASKKQLQTEKQQHKSEIDCIKTEKTAIENEIKTLKYQVIQLEAEKDKLETEVQNTKTEFEKVIKSNKQVFTEKEKFTAEIENVKMELEKVTEVKKNVHEAENKNDESTEKSINLKVKNEKTSRSQTTRKAKEKNGTKLPEKKEEEKPFEKKISRKTKNQTEKRKNNSSEKSGVIFEDKKSKTQIYEDVKMKTKSTEKSAVISENNKSKTQIYEEPDENSNNENAQKVRSTDRRQLRCVENVPASQCLVNNKDLSSSKSKGSKRKEQDESVKDKLHEKKTLKKIKLQDINETENISSINKPQNLRVKLLKGNVATHDIPLPSPRMTRGRKRLCNLNAKESVLQNSGSSRNVRS